MGRSRGGLTTKIHAVTYAEGLPFTLLLTAGQAPDGRSVGDMFGTVGPGQTLLAVTAYDSNRLRDSLADIFARAVIRPIPCRSNPPPLDRMAQPDRAVLLKAQALQGHRHPIRDTRRQLSRPRPTGGHTHLVAGLCRCPSQRTPASLTPVASNRGRRKRQERDKSARRLHPV